MPAQRIRENGMVVAVDHVIKLTSGPFSAPLRRRNDGISGWVMTRPVVCSARRPKGASAILVVCLLVVLRPWIGSEEIWN
jgi:hypothetical protein